MHRESQTPLPVPAGTYLHAELTEKIIAAAMRVHSTLGPGLLESCYEACMVHELTERGLNTKRQLELPLSYHGKVIEVGFRIDILVEDAIVLELKAIDRLLPIHEAQLHTYLRLSGYRVGLLMNFNVLSLRDGIKRRVI